MALFGGVQVFTILISIIRSKFIAVWLGPMGMGIASLLNATMGLINGFTNFGLDRSAVKDISFGVSKDDVSQQVKIIQIVRRLVWFTVLLGVFVMIIASSILSEIAFGNSDYTFAFIWVSIALLFKQLTNGELAILQGLRRLSNLAKANLLGNLLGLLITLPLYYFYRIDAIVPSMIIASITSYIFTFYFSFKEGRGGNPISNKIALREGKEMIHLGVMLSISSLIALATAYIIQVFISNIGSIDEVGLYNAGFVILNTYVGLIFTAMATDYYPRLAAIHDKIEEVRKMVFEQAYMAILIITPIIVVFLMFAPFIINLLYSEEFSPIVGFVNWGILGMVFKTVSFSIGYVIIAKGDSKLFIKTAVGFNTVLLIINFLGYYFGGLHGLGISFFIYYIIHFMALKIITYKRYSFYFLKGFYPVFTVCALLCITAFGLTFFPSAIIKYGLLGLLSAIAVIYSYYQINRKMNIKEFLKSFLKR